MRGPWFQVQDCQVAKRTSFTGADGKVVYQMQIEGFGYSQTFTTGDSNEAQLWPAMGAEVHLYAKMEPVKNMTGCYKLGVPMFKDARVPEPKKTATSAA